MTTSLFDSRQARIFLLLLGLLLYGVGCTGSPDFRENVVYIHKQEKEAGETLSPEVIEDVGNILTAFFGTPDEPRLPELADVDLSELMEIRRLQMAAGPVKSDQQGNPTGLYREHCAHCHGVTGDGYGPTAAFLNPYPRDYRLGVFKFKSTPKGQRPTHDDLARILHNGIPGTSMPSFRVLDNDERETLAQYVRYLSIRGEVERLLVYEAMDSGERLIDASDQDVFSEQLEVAKEIIAEVAVKWLDAESFATEVSAHSDWDLAESVKKGRELFYGNVANCIKCHGESALGDGQQTDYDDWAKELDPTNPESVHEYVKLGALKPRNIHPRNLRSGVYRGGRRPVDLFWRVRNGIDGTPMPSVPSTMTDDDVWHLIDYVRSLPYESISQPTSHSPSYQRDRL